MADGISCPNQINDLAVEPIDAVGERLDCANRTTLAGSSSNTFRLSTKNRTALCRSGLPRPNVAQPILLLGASLGAASRSYKNQDSRIKRTVLGQAPAYAYVYADG